MCLKRRKWNEKEAGVGPFKKTYFPMPVSLCKRFLLLSAALNWNFLHKKPLQFVCVCVKLELKSRLKMICSTLLLFATFQYIRSSIRYSQASLLATFDTLKSINCQIEKNWKTIFLRGGGRKVSKFSIFIHFCEFWFRLQFARLAESSNNESSKNFLNFDFIFGLFNADNFLKTESQSFHDLANNQ